MTDLARIEEGSSAQMIVARMEIARQQLAEAKTIRDAKAVADGAAAICEWLRRQTDLGLEIQNDGSLLKLQAEARMGEFLALPGAVAERGRPGKTSQPVTFSAPTHKEIGINREAARRCREVAAVPPQALRQLADEATRRGRELTRESVLKAAKKIRPAAPATNGNGHAPLPACPVILPDGFRDAITVGDSRELASRLPDASVALCLTDPVYDRTDDYRWLARECERVLAPGGSLIAQCGNARRFDCEVAMRESGLTFVDLLAEVYPYALGRLFPSKIFIGWKPHLWFSKGPRASAWVMNRLAVGGKPYANEAKEIHPWGDSEQFAAGLLGKLCGPGDLVWDPFAGSGTVPVVARRLGLPFVAFELDADTARSAQDRLDGTRRELSPQCVLEWTEAA